MSDTHETNDGLSNKPVVALSRQSCLIKSNGGFSKKGSGNRNNVVLRQISPAKRPSLPNSGGSKCPVDYSKDFVLSSSSGEPLVRGLSTPVKWSLLPNGGGSKGPGNNDVFLSSSSGEPLVEGQSSQATGSKGPVNSSKDVVGSSFSGELLARGQSSPAKYGGGSKGPVIRSPFSGKPLVRGLSSPAKYGGGSKGPVNNLKDVVLSSSSGEPLARGLSSPAKYGGGSKGPVNNGKDIIRSSSSEEPLVRGLSSPAKYGAGSKVPVNNSKDVVGRSSFSGELLVRGQSPSAKYDAGSKRPVNNVVRNSSSGEPLVQGQSSTAKNGGGSKDPVNNLKDVVGSSSSQLAAIPFGVSSSRQNPGLPTSSDDESPFVDKSSDMVTSLNPLQLSGDAIPIGGFARAPTQPLEPPQRGNDPPPPSGGVEQDVDNTWKLNMESLLGLIGIVGALAVASIYNIPGGSVNTPGGKARVGTASILPYGYGAHVIYLLSGFTILVLFILLLCLISGCGGPKFSRFTILVLALVTLGELGSIVTHMLINLDLLHGYAPVWVGLGFALALFVVLAIFM